MCQVCIFDAWNHSANFPWPFCAGPGTILGRLLVLPICFLDNLPPAGAWGDLGKCWPNQSTNIKQSPGLKIRFLFDISVQHLIGASPSTRTCFHLLLRRFTPPSPLLCCSSLPPPLSSLLPFAAHLSLSFPFLVLSSLLCTLSPLTSSSNHSTELESYSGWPWSPQGAWNPSLEPQFPLQLKMLGSQSPGCIPSGKLCEWRQVT